MGSVVLLDPQGKTVTVTDTYDFLVKIYTQGYEPQSGSIQSNLDKIKGNGELAPALRELLTLGDFANPQSDVNKVLQGMFTSTPPTTDASKLTSGILPAARVGSGSVTAAKLASDVPGAIAVAPELRAASGSVAAVVTASGALVVQKHNPVDASSGARTMTLPIGAPEGSQLSVEKVDISTNTVTITGNLRGTASSSIALVYQRETVQLRADASGSWWPTAGHRTKTSLDTASVAAVKAAITAGDIVTGTTVDPAVQIGDSLTQNWSAYNTALAAALGRPLNNIGIGGQGTLQIAARQGGSPALLTVTGNVIPASGAVAVTAYSVNLLARPSDGTQSIKGVLAGVSGTLQMAQSSGTWSYTFTRDTAGIPMPCSPNTPFVTGLEYEDAWPIIWTGRNDIGQGAFRTPLADIVTAIKGMLAWSRRGQRAVVLSVLPRADEDSTGSAARTILDQLNAGLQSAFPQAFVDIAAILRTDAAFAIAGITKTTQDATDITNGLTPTSFRGSDIVHLNAAGYTVLNTVLPHILDDRGWHAASLASYPSGASTAALHDNGVAGATHRYVPSVLALSSGTAASTLPDSIGSATLAAVGTSAGNPTVTAEGAGQVLSFVSTTGKSMNATTTVATPFTVALVVKSTATAYNIAVVDGYRIQRASNGSWALAGGASDGSTALVTLPGSDNYVVIFGVCNGSSSQLAVNGTVTSSAGSIVGPGAGLSGKIQLGPQVSGASLINIAEANIWPFALTAAQQAAHITAMKARYAFIA